MTAGRSILHQEMPDATIPILGTQLWLNLPAAHKMTAPAYREITENDVPIYDEDGLFVRVLAGTFREVTGPVRGTYVDPIYLDVTVSPHGTFSLAIPEKNTAFIFLLEGRLDFPEGRSVLVPETRGILLGQGEHVSIQSGSGARFLFIAGQPLNEPIAWGGPIVMNSQEELHSAFQQLRAGTFIQD
jgi:hypothetical protein